MKDYRVFKSFNKNVISIEPEGEKGEGRKRNLIRPAFINVVV
jgi:hypothetical protein